MTDKILDEEDLNFLRRAELDFDEENDEPDDDEDDYWDDDYDDD